MISLEPFVFSAVGCRRVEQQRLRIYFIIKKERRHWVGPGWSNAYEFGTAKDQEKKTGIPVALIQNDMMVSCPFTALTLKYNKFRNDFTVVTAMQLRKSGPSIQ